MEPGDIYVGSYRQIFNELTGQNIPLNPIYQSHGLLVHIKKRHADVVNYVSYISEIIANPDYVGHNQNEPDSIELVKCFDKNLMLCIKLDRSSERLYVASLFAITNSKLQHRLQSGRLVTYESKDGGV